MRDGRLPQRMDTPFWYMPTIDFFSHHGDLCFAVWADSCWVPGTNNVPRHCQTLGWLQGLSAGESKDWRQLSCRHCNQGELANCCHSVSLQGDGTQLIQIMLLHWTCAALSD
jgi:hypothetical protein